jgi:FAD/FMN-containing dehydrogenase
MKNEVIAGFAGSLRGSVIQQGDAGYDDARKLYNAMIDKRPKLIARCADAADVIAAVNFGRDNGLTIAIRGGAHNGAGFASVDDGLVIDLSTMRGVRVDPKGRTARVVGAARPEKSTMPRMHSDKPCPSESSQPLESPA